MYEQVVKDCKTAIENDSQSVKGYFFMGQSDVELEHYEDAILHLTKGIIVIMLCFDTGVFVCFYPIAFLNFVKCVICNIIVFLNCVNVLGKITVTMHKALLNVDDSTCTVLCASVRG